MTLRPEEISLDALPRVRRDGVDPAAAQELLRRAAWDLMQALASNAKLTQTVAELRQQSQALEAQIAELEASAAKRRDPDDLVRSLLASTQKTVQEQRGAARQEAELLLKKAHARAAVIEREARSRAQTAIADAATLEAKRAELSSELRGALETVLALYDGQFSPPSNATGA
jgi:cell division septum initiation protein DivIVA